jgi:hypothetical protein
MATMPDYMLENGSSGMWKSLRTAPHPLDSLDLAPIDFFEFGRIERALQRAEFQNPDKLLDAVVDLVTDISPDILMDIFSQWRDQLQLWTDSSEESVGSALFYNKKLSLISTDNRDAKGELNTFYLVIPS